MLSICSCSTAKIYSAPDAVSLAKQHKIVAVLPTTVAIAPRKNITNESNIEQEKNESLTMQKEVFSWLLEQKRKSKFQAELMDIETLNAKLKKLGYPANGMSPAELCEALNVDGIIQSGFSYGKIMSEGAAIAMNILGGGGNSNEAHGAISIYDAKNKKMIWNYDNTYSGGLTSSPSTLVDALMKEASKKMPYMQKK